MFHKIYQLFFPTFLIIKYYFVFSLYIILLRFFNFLYKKIIFLIYV